MRSFSLFNLTDLTSGKIKAVSLLLGGGLVLIPSFISAIRSEQFRLADFQHTIRLKNINILNEERVVFHSYRVSKGKDQWLKTSNDEKDNEQATLLVITKDTTYLLKDGYEERFALSERRQNYWKKFERWQKQRKMLAELSLLKKERERKEPFLRRNHPEMVNIYNAAWQALYQNDEELQFTIHNSRRSEAQLLRIGQRYGYTSPEYEQQKQVVEKWNRQAKEREKKLWTLAQWKNAPRELPAAKLSATESSVTQESSQAAANSDRQAAPDPSNLSQQSDSADTVLLSPPTAQEKIAIYQNRIDGRPDRAVIATAGEREALFQLTDSPITDAMEMQFGDFYRAVRDRHIQRYVNQYREIILAPKKYNSSIKTDRRLSTAASCGVEAQAGYSSPVSDSSGPGSLGSDSSEAVSSRSGSSESEVADKTSLNASGQQMQKNMHYRVDILSNDETRYIAEDCNGDGITETFLVQESEKFHWGVADMPNAVLIYNNRDPQVQKLIGDLVKWVFEGNRDLLARFKENQKQVLESVEKNIEKKERIGKQRFE